MNADFVVMVGQTHHERHCILSLSKDQSRTTIRILRTQSFLRLSAKSAHCLPI